MQFKLTLIFLAFAISFSFAAYQNRTIRFWDDLMMRHHHKHQTFEQFSNIQSIPFSTINVHLIPHTHDDVGWLKTLDEYYYGSSNTIQNAQVQYVLDTVIDQLEKDPNKHFIYVEVAFFIRWWREQTPEKQDSVKRLVANGQLEFINGGWCMNDEAAPYYEDVIDQMTIGHQFLKETFNVTIDIGWHIDPFGHSAAHASLFSQMGFNAFFFARIDYQDKDLRLEEKAMEMIWSPNQASGDDHSIFTSVNYYHYEAPPSFCFDQNCDDEPIMDDPRLEEYNIDERAKTFVTYFKNMALHYRHADLMHTMGSDFQYSNAHKYFKNVDKLIKYINAHPEWGVNIFYSTPSKYIKSINKLNIPYPLKTDDFWPYADNAHAYWTGYFVSRVAIKGIVKEAGRFLQSVRTLFALAQINDNSEYVAELRNKMQAKIAGLEEAMGVLQHHDAVAGTSKQKVAGDYMYILSKALKKVHKVLFKYIANKNNQNLNEELNYFVCNWNSTAKECPGVYKALLQGQNILVTTYNPGSERVEVVRVKVPNLSLQVLNSTNDVIPSDHFCASEIDGNDCTLFFKASMAQNSFSYFKISQNTDYELLNKQNSSLPGKNVEFNYFSEDDDPMKVQKYKTYAFENGKSLKIFEDLQTFAYNDGLKAYSFHLSYNHYRSYPGPQQPSGAYIFRPDNLTINGSLLYNIPRYAKAFVGKNLIQISVYGDRITTDIRFFRCKEIYENALEVESFVDSIPIFDEVGKEVTINIKTSINNHNEFYTDSNGLEMQKRKINFRPTWKLNVSEPVSGNYYPINAMISINNSETKFTVLNDRSQGGSSYRRGEIEIMIHRRILNDDWRGVGEPLNETEHNGTIGLTQRMKHYLVFSDVAETRERSLQYILDTAPIVVLANETLPEFLVSPTKQQTSLNLNTFYLEKGLKIYLKDFDGDDLFLYRVFNNDENNIKRVPLNFEKDERSLTTTMTKAEMEAKKLKWVAEKKNNLKPNSTSVEVSENIYMNNQEIEVKPLEIKTFFIRVPKRA